MSHVLTYPRHTDKSAAVVGSEFLHDLALADLSPHCRRIDVTTTPLAVAAQQTLHGPSSIYLPSGTQHLQAGDIPALGRLAKNCRVVVSGSHWSDVEVEQWWDTSSTRKIFDVSRMSTKTARKLLAQWVSEHGRLSAEHADRVCALVEYDPARAVSLARKAAAFSGRLGASDLTLLASDVTGGDVVEHLLHFRRREAIDVAATLTGPQCRAVLLRLPSSLTLLARINSAVLRFPHPSGEASKETRIPQPRLAQYWDVAGRYTPQDVLYRMDLTRYLIESSPRDRSALVSLAAMW